MEEEVYTRGLGVGVEMMVLYILLIQVKVMIAILIIHIHLIRIAEVDLVVIHLVKKQNQIIKEIKKLLLMINNQSEEV